MTTAADSPAADIPAATPDREHEVSRESLRQRCEASVQALPSMSLALVAIGAMLDGAVPRRYLVAWLALMFCSTLLRMVVCRRFLKALPSIDRPGFERMQRVMHATLILNTTIAGASIWLPGVEQAAEARLLVTLLACFYAIGSLVNASSHFGSYAAGIVANLGQLILFWILQGNDGPKISLLLAIIGYLLTVAGRYNSRMFRTSFLARFQNQELLRQLVVEKQEAEAARRVAETANQSKSRFLAAASHDLRQPLHALSLYSGVLELQVTDPAVRGTVGKLQATVEALDHTFEGLLELSSLDAQNLKPKWAVVHAGRLFRQLGDEFRPQAHAKGLALDIVAPDVSMLTDEILLRRVLRNLLSNAVRYGGAGRIRLAANDDGEWVVITVSDQGPGIAPEHQERIFDEFDQLDNPGRDRSKGFGLGLAVVRRIDRLLDLRLRLDSAPGAGATFTIRVPIARSAADGAPDARYEPEFVATFPASGLAAAAGLRVLAIEDDPVVRDALESQLRLWGVEVVPFALEEEAVEALLEAPPTDLVFIIDDMLGMRRSGLEIARGLVDRVGQRRIVLMTGNSHPERLAEIAGDGFTVLAKPVLPRDLLAVLTRVDSEV